MNVLHLEDNDADAALFEALLHREWPDCRITRLWTRREFETVLQTESFDIILSDHSMPGFDGLSALEIVRSCCPETPFVFLSGTIGEERAIEALKHGAVDYVLKNSPSRLLPAVHSALQHGRREAAKRRAEESLRQSREQFRQIAESIDDFIVLLDEHGHCLYSNPTFRRLLGKSEVPIGLSIFEDVHPEDKERFRNFLILSLQQQNGGRDIDYRLLLTGGVLRHLEARVSLPKNRSDKPPVILLAGRDVTERKKAEELLQEQASLLGKARDAICVIDLRFKITQWNVSAERIFGKPAAQALGGNLRDLVFADQITRFDTAFALTLAEGEWQGEFRLPGTKGRDRVVESSWSLVNDAHGAARSILCIHTDVTNRKLLELELQRSQRIEGLGMLAGGIAHDLNNVLSPILMSIGLLRSFVSAPQNQSVIDALEQSATHGSELVRQILLFARGGEGERTQVQMGEFLGELKGFLRTALRKTIKLDIDHDDDVWPISADATQIKQVLMNLCVNARDAMPGAGSIRISANNVQVAPCRERGFHGEIAPGPYVRLSVADTGSGIPPEVLEKIFDPFFTTKEIGKGTGLGLSTIAGIVQSHGGAIQVQSLPGQGTNFRIYLPALLIEAPRQPAVPTEELPRGNGEMILIIDDDEGILLVAEKILTAQGYRVCTAADGQAGLIEFRRRGEEIDLVICDQVMPGLSGSGVLGQIHRDAPWIRLMTMSGLTDAPMLEIPEVGISVTALRKPINAESLLRTVRRVMDTTVA